MRIFTGGAPWFLSPEGEGGEGGKGEGDVFTSLLAALPEEQRGMIEQHISTIKAEADQKIKDLAESQHISKDEFLNTIRSLKAAEKKPAETTHDYREVIERFRESLGDEGAALVGQMATSVQRLSQSLFNQNMKGIARMTEDKALLEQFQQVAMDDPAMYSRVLEDAEGTFRAFAVQAAGGEEAYWKKREDGLREKIAAEVLKDYEEKVKKAKSRTTTVGGSPAKPSGKAATFEEVFLEAKRELGE